MRIFLQLIPCLLSVSLVHAAAKPNVLFIAVDDLNHWVGYLGRNKQTLTPNMDRLARGGLVFDNAYTPTDDGRTWTKSFRHARKPAPNFTGYSGTAVKPDGSVGVLYERGDLTDASKKAGRYDEVGFTVAPFANIRTPLPPLHPRGSTK